MQGFTGVSSCPARDNVFACIYTMMYYVIEKGTSEGTSRNAILCLIFFLDNILRLPSYDAIL